MENYISQSKRQRLEIRHSHWQLSTNRSGERPAGSQSQW